MAGKCPAREPPRARSGPCVLHAVEDGPQRPSRTRWLVPVCRVAPGGTMGSAGNKGEPGRLCGCGCACVGTGPRVAVRYIYAAHRPRGGAQCLYTTAYIPETTETPPAVPHPAFLNYTELAHALWQPPAPIQGAPPHGWRLSVRRVASAVGPSSRGKSSCTRSNSARVPCLPPCPPSRP